MKKKLLVASLALIGGLVVCSTASAKIEGSAHDFSEGDWAGGQICLPCHAPHGNKNETGSLLWNHALSTETNYTLYSNNATLDSATVQPQGVSKFCLSCHDGTVALDAYGAHDGNDATKLAADDSANLGTDLSNDHPVSMLYDSAADKGLVLKASLDLAITPLFGAGSDQVECASCHDVHNKHGDSTGATGLLNYTMAGSALCLQCHAK